MRLSLKWIGEIRGPIWSIVGVLVILSYWEITQDRVVSLNSSLAAPPTFAGGSATQHLSLSNRTQVDAIRSINDRRFSEPQTIQALLDATRGKPQFITPLSGCRMARWILPILGVRPERRDCYNELRFSEANDFDRVVSNATVHLIQPNDTIYITYYQIEDFVQDVLPLINIDVVLISGQAEYLRAPGQWAIDSILSNSHVVQWFCQNLPKYGGSNPYHPKLSSFPFGLKQRVRDDPLGLTNPVYEQVFLQSLRNPPTRNTTVFAGYISKQSNLNYRADVTVDADFMPPVQYYQRMAQSAYVLSPNGDRPECYRHYEALGLGAAPLTNLPMDLFPHFLGTGLVFNHQEWINIEKLESTLNPRPIVNRNAVLELYWMEYVDWISRRNLTWWNRYQHPQNPTTFHSLLLEK